MERERRKAGKVSLGVESFFARGKGALGTGGLYRQGPSGKGVPTEEVLPKPQRAPDTQCRGCG